MKNKKKGKVDEVKADKTSGRQGANLDQGTDKEKLQTEKE